ncbi:MAG TPA: DUF6206 family protein [Solirubrobacterales bacterium]
MSPATGRLSADELRQLDATVDSALEEADESRLLVLGGGEISLVLGWPPADPTFACRRLPLFPTRARFDAYRRTLVDYVDALGERGVDVVETELSPIDRDDGTIAGYAVQPLLPAETLAPAVLADRAPAAGHPLVDAIVETAFAAIGPRLGIDAQLSNWTWERGRLRYLDVTTPMIWAPDGSPRLDLDLLMRPLPAILRRPVKRFVAPGILDGYRHRQGVANDLLGNLIKERLDAWIPVFLEPVNRSLETPINEQEVRSYYRSDARLWEWLLRIRRLDRVWQRHVRRRPYQFLLPRGVAR